MLVVSVKYIALVMRADNHGEGGILALLALLPRDRARARDAAASSAPRCSRRRRHHARHLRARRGRGPRDRDARVPAVRRAGHASSSSSSCSSCRSAARPRVGSVFGPIMLVWFVDHRRPRRRARSSGTPAILAALNPVHAVSLLRLARRGRLPGARRRRARGHRRRGALRGHGALRPAADPAGVVRGRAPGAAAELLRPGRAHPPHAGGGAEPVLSSWRHGRCSIRCSPSPRWPPSSPRRRSSRARSRSPSRRSSSATPRASRSSTPRARRRADLHPRGERGARARLPPARGVASARRARWAPPTASR